MAHGNYLTSRIAMAIRRRWQVFAVLILAAFLRLYALDMIDVRYDEASAPQFALSIARGQWLATAPFSGSVASHPPVFLYLLALPYLVTRDLLVVAAFRALLDVLAIGLLWWLCERYFSRRVAFIASLLFAVSPWAIQYARKMSIVTPAIGSVILLFGLLEALRRRNAWGWAIAGFGLALCVGSHLTAIYLVPITVAAIVLGYRTLKPIPVMLGLLPVIVIGAVYLSADASHGFSNVQALLATFRAPGSINFDALKLAFWTSGGAHLSDLTDGAYAAWQVDTSGLLEWLDILQIALLGAGLLYVVARCIRSIRKHAWPDAATFALLLLWWCVPVLLQLRHNQPLQLHYLTPLYPVPFILEAELLDSLLGRAAGEPKGASVRRALATLCLSAVVIWQVFTTVHFNNFVANHDTSAGGYGPPVRNALQIAALARNRYNTCECGGGVIIVSPGGDPLVNEQATLFNVILADTPHRFANADSGIILRSEAAQYIFTPGSERALRELFDHVQTSHVVSYSLPVRNGSTADYTYVSMDHLSIQGMKDVPVAQWKSGVQLAGYSVSMSDTLHLHVLLQVRQIQPPGVDYHWFNHILSGDQKVAQLDGGGIQPSNWLTGDLLLQWFDIPLPSPVPQQFSVKVGSYTYPELQTVSVTLADGQLSDGVVLDIK